MAESQSGTIPVPAGVWAIIPEPAKPVPAGTVGHPPELTENVYFGFTTVAVPPEPVEDTG